MPDKSNSGQILIVVVLTLIVALTVGLSLASRTVLNLRLSRQSEESQRAFQAAEAGVEQVIQTNAGLSQDTFANNSSYTTSVSHPSGQSFLLNGGELVDQDVGVDVWLSNYPDFVNPVTTNLTIWWGPPNNQTACDRTGGAKAENIKSAIEVVVLSGSKLLPTTQKYFFEAVGCSGRIIGPQVTAGVAAGAAPPANTTIIFGNKTTQISVTNGLIARVIPIFNASKINVTSDPAPLPDQGTVIQSTGTAGETARRIQYFASFPQVPVEIFPYTLISQ